ncbi:family 3 glycoside hydrolase [Melampsora larici-populina 98AG31]|uniref:beta-glucosidase n=1 Tax=Melampsora larici-populina (strain 98AG31 / pathotype 3-4-7) TaxID=747676 RepID=F4S421_MELLP|nr:family 3 glycoside hydrolase [Melampsora larici-populina 98AG31]EGG00630.1 family 3 glycoside hydrolase [Melampsora larici-populina 98AG31]
MEHIFNQKSRILRLSPGPCTGTTSEVNGRIHFPAICMQDGPAGLRNVDDLVSAFPAGISVAATWNRKLMRARGVAMGEEWRAKGAHVYLGPAVDVTRDPRAGRSWEAFGADPYLNGEAAYETVKGVQSQGVQTCVKHLIGYQQEQYRFTMTSQIDDKTLKELYLKPFQRAIDAGVTCVMCSYNKFNGLSACKNPTLTGDEGILREELGFQGYVVSDWGATHDGNWNVKRVNETALAGIDVEMPGGFMLIGGGVYDNLEEAVNENYVTDATIDKMATRFISAWYKLGQDQGFPQISFNVHDQSANINVNARSNKHTKLIRKIASASAVLLKNSDDILPLSIPSTIALIGLDAGPISNTDCEMNACKLGGTIPVGWGSGTNSLKHVVSPAIAIQDMICKDDLPTIVSTSLTDDISSAISVAEAAEIALVFVYTGEIGAGFTRVEGNLGDRKNLNLLQNGEELIKAVSAVNNKTIVVIHSVGSVVMETWVDLPGVKAIIMAGLPGEQTGPGIADVLFGKVNPSGRLPYTIAKSEDDFGVKVYPEGLLNGLEPIVDYKEGLFTDYRRFNQLNTTVRYCFGHGLSYTTFRYSQVNNSCAIQTLIGLTKSDHFFQVTNDGPRDGTEVAQLYLTFPSGLGEPPKQLRGFDSVFIPRGETQTISLELKTRDVSVFDTNLNKWITPDRGFNVYVGSSLLDIHLEGTI